MKFANIGKLSYTESRKRLGFGDYMQLLAIDNLYQQMEAINDVVYLDAQDIAAYRGEKLILPINLFFYKEPWLYQNSDIVISEDITPVFLGLSLKNTFQFTDKNTAFLNKYSPIGCRDYYTYQRVSQHGIPAYIAGCLTMTLPKRDANTYSPNKVFFVDIPSELKKYIPNDIWEAGEIIHHECELGEKEFEDFYSTRKATKDLLKRYQKEAALVVTYRLHCAAPCLAMGIPVIVARPYHAFTCDWLEQFTHVYTEEDYANIVWNAEPIHVEEYKEIARNVAIKRLNGTCTQVDIEKLHNYHLRGYSIDYTPTDMPINHFIYEIEKRFHKEDYFDYAMWGVSNTAEKIYEYLSMHYPNARLVKVIDSFSEKTFHGITSEKPEVLLKSDPFITIVATVYCIASGAVPLFSKLGKDPSQYIYAADTFI